MRRPGQKQRRIVILLLTVLTFGIAYYGGNKYSEEEPPKISGVLLRPASPAPDFELSDQHGDSFTIKRLAGRWSLILLDSNPASDPPAWFSLVRIHNRLALEPIIQQQVQFIYISRSSTINQDSITAGLGSGFFSLAGEAVDLDDTFSRFGASDIKHGFTLYLIDPDARLHALFTDRQDAASIASDLITLISTHRT